METEPTVNPDPRYPTIKTRVYTAYIAVIQIFVPSYVPNQINPK